jgi:hypothetical protein
MNTAKDPSRMREPAAEPLLAITLCSSNAPLPMPTFTDARLRGLALFKSRRREEGRERFRLHLGYFQTVTEAERVLAVLRPSWPCAFIAAAPEGSLGSLENTAATRFTIVEPLEAASPEPSPEPPPVIPAKVTVLPTVVAPPPPVAVAPAAVPMPTRAPAPLPVLTSIVRTAPASVLELEPEPAAVPPPVAAPVPVQRYAVQLAFGRTPIDLGGLPDLAIYEGYLLYAIETEPGGRRLYGVRLGFYDDVLSARLVAQYVRSEFRDVTIVPVSEREVARATAARIRLGAPSRARGRAPATPWPSTALLVAFDPASHLPLAT